MAYVGNTVEGSGTSDATTGDHTFTLPASSTNDLLVVFVIKKFGSLTTPVTGWTLEHNTRLGGCSIYCFTQSNGGSLTTFSSGTGTTNSAFLYTACVVKDTLTSGYKDISAVRTTATTDNIQAPSVTTTANDCLIISCAACDTLQLSAIQSPGYIKVGSAYLSSVGWVATQATYKETAGATGVQQFQSGGYNTDDPPAVTIAIKSSGTPVLESYTDVSSAANAPAQVLHAFGYTGGSGNLTTADLNITTLITSINGLTTVNEANGSSNNQSIQDGFITNGINDNVADQMLVTSSTMASSLDVSSSILCVSASIETDLYGWDIPSFGIGLSDGTNYAVWRLAGRDTTPAPRGANFPFLFEVDGGFEYETGGTFASSSIDEITRFYYNKTTFANLFMGPLHKIQTMKALGGSSSRPNDFSRLSSIAKSSILNTVQNQSGQATGQYFICQSVTIGNGGTDTVYWDSTQQSVEYPGAPSLSGSELRTQAQISEAALTFDIDAGSSNTVILQSQVFNMGDYHNFKVTSGTLTADSVVVANATPTITALGLDKYAGFTFDACKELILSGFNSRSTKTLGSAAISNCVDTYAVTVTNQDELEALKNVSFSGNNFSIKITGNHTATWSLSGATVTGGTGSYDIEYTGTGSLTIECDAGSGFSTGRTTATGGGSITISAPTFDLVVNSDQSASQIVVYTTNTQTALSTVASGTQLTYTHSSETVDITVHKDGFIPYRQTALALSGNITVNVTLVASREYDSGHGLTYTTDASIYDNFNYITSISQANPAVVIYSGADNFNNNDIISIQDVVGMTEINGKRYTVANVDTGANTFELSGINSTGYTAYSSGGVALSGLSVPTFGPSGRAVFSLLLEEFRTRAALDNLPFPIEMDGSGSFYLVDGVEGTADSDIENMTACGVGYLDVDGTETARWSGVESIGTIPGGATGEYQQQDGTGTTDARTTGAFDEVIKVKGDTDHGNFNYEGHLVLKYQINGYYQSRVDVLNTYGISALEPTHYIVAMEPAATGIATGDPAITISITDHTAAPITVGGKSFDYEIVGGANSAEDILRELNYNHSLDATYNGKDPFNWPDLVIEVGGNYETQYGRVEGQDTTTTYHGVYVSQSGGDHPGFTRFQSNDGTYYVPAVVSSISVTGMPTAGANIRLQITNETAKTASGWDTLTPSVSTAALGDKILRSTGLGTENTAGLYYVCTTAGTIGATEPTWSTTPGGTTNDGTVVWTTYKILYYDADPASASYANTYIDNEEFATGDTFGIRFAEMNAGTSFKTFETTGVVSSTGFTVVVSVTAESVYATNAVDGSSAAVTGKFTADFVNDEIDVDVDQDFAATEAYAYYCYELTQSQGMYQFWGAITAVDEANYRINTSVVSIYFDSTAAFVKQTDSARIFRSDGLRPALDPTTGDNGIEINWRNPVYGYDAGGGGFTAGDRATLNSASTYDPTTDTLEGSLTYEQAQRIMLAESAGKVSVSGTTVTFRDQADTKDRITATVDANGQRTSVTVDGS